MRRVNGPRSGRRAVVVLLAIIASLASPISSVAAANGNTIAPVDDQARDHPTSVAVGPDGNPIMSYASRDGKLMVAFCLDTDCTSATKVVIEEAAWRPSIVIDSDGNPVIAYEGRGDRGGVFALRVARCLDPVCASMTVTDIDTPPASFRFGTPSLQLAADGSPVVAYSRTFGGRSSSDLRMARCVDAACSRVRRSTIRTGVVGQEGTNDRMALDQNGRPVISYSQLGAFDGGLGLAFCEDKYCTSTTIMQRPELPGGQSSLELDVNDAPVIALSSQMSGRSSVTLLRCHDTRCVDSTATPVTSGFASHTAILELDRDGNPALAMWHPASIAKPLVVSRCADLLCSSATHQMVSGGARHPALVLDQADRPVVSFIDETSGTDTLSLLSCAGRFCEATPLDDYPAPGTYFLRNEFTGWYLDADADGSVGTSWQANYDDQWQLHAPQGEPASFALRSVLDTFLDADASGVVDQSRSQSNDDQWRLVPAGDGSFYIGNLVYPGWLSIETDSGSAVLHGGQRALERWQFVPLEDMAPPGEPIVLQSVATQRWLDADAPNAVGQSVIAMADDVWLKVDIGDGYFHLVNRSSGRLLDSDGVGRAASTSRQAAEDDRWQFVPVDDGTFELRNGNDGGLLQAQGWIDGFGVAVSGASSASTRWIITLKE